MFHVIRAIFWIFLTWRWGDWRNWKKYHSSILFFVTGDLLYNVLCSDHMMWRFEASAILPSHVITTIFICITIYPCTVILYLGKYPTQITMQILWIILWAMVMIGVEWLNYKLGYLTYHNGWNTWWTVLFAFVSVPMIRLHHVRPLWAYGLSGIFVVFLVIIFDVPLIKP